jgi:ATP-dependent helicase HrpB
MADAITRAMRADKGSLLAFLPGAAEIRRTAAMLEGRLEAETCIAELFGALAGDEQDRAIAPAAPGRRKIVLATAIAETSITIEGVRMVVDSGLSRVPHYEPDVGVTRLDTVRASRAAADQRRGRAGRTEPGICYRLWDEPQTAALAVFSRPEILAADLSGFALDLAAWGSRLEDLAFLDPPPRAAFSEAQGLLRELGAIDEDGRITEEGKRLRRLPLPPRLARMVIDAADIGAAMPAAQIAILIGERGLGGNDVDLNDRLEVFHRERSTRAREARAMAAGWAETAQSEKPSPSGGEKSDPTAGALLALAFPERIAKNRGTSDSGDAFLLANGRGAQVDKASALARTAFLAVGELAGSAAASRILLAAPITLAEIETSFADRIAARSELSFDPASASVRLRRLRQLGAITLSEQSAPAPADETSARLLADGIARLGVERLPWTSALRQWRDRVMFLRAAEDSEWPDVSDAALAADIDWLAQTFAGKTALAELSADEFAAVLTARLPFPVRRRLDAEAPVHFIAPTGTRALIDYVADGGPKISIRVQELFGLAQHPTIAGGKVPLLIELLSPAQRPVQLTRDLPGFWRGSYAAVRSEMRGRYPKHPWPEDPLNAAPTRRTKRAPRP